MFVLMCWRLVADVVGCRVGIVDLLLTIVVEPSPNVKQRGKTVLLVIGVVDLVGGLLATCCC